MEKKITEFAFFFFPLWSPHLNFQLDILGWELMLDCLCRINRDCLKLNPDEVGWMRRG